MTDYSNTFGGRAKDKNSTTILGVDWDTQYSNIETAVNSKQDKVGSATNGNLIEFNASSVPIDSGIASSYIDNVEADVDARLDAAESTLSFITPSIPSPTYPYWHRAGDLWLYEGDSAYTHTALQCDNETANTWHTVGATGSGKDVIWTPLDVLTGKSAGTLICLVSWRGHASTSLTNSMQLYTSSLDTGQNTDNPTSEIWDDVDIAGEEQEYDYMVYIPCKWTSGVGHHFSFKFTRTGFSSLFQCNLYLKGFIDDLD